MVRVTADYAGKNARWKIPTRVRLFPLLFFLAYLGFTILLFAHGPWPWPVQDKTKLYVYLFAGHLSLGLGYLSVSFRKPGDYYGRIAIRKLLILAIILNLLMLFPTAYHRSGSFFPDVKAGIVSPGEAYTVSFINRARSSVVVEYMRMIFAPLLFAMLPLTLYYWRLIGPRLKILAVICVFGYPAISVATGIRKGFVDPLLIAPWILLAAHLSGALRVPTTLKGVAVVLIILLGVSAFGLFSLIAQDRPGSVAANAYFPPAGIYADSDHWLVRYLPQRAKVGVLGLSALLTQGYYALSLSLEEPFVPMFGLGHSMFLTRNASRVLGVKELERMSYPARIESKGWDARRYWSSIYPWIASDVSFPGSLLVIFIIGRLFGLAWLDVLKGKNPFAIGVFAQFVIMLFYFPANNQCVQEGEGFLSFYGLLIVWLLTRRRYVWRK